MAPFEVTVLSVTLNAAGIVPSANNRFPPPNVIGNSFSQKASTKSCLPTRLNRPASVHQEGMVNVVSVDILTDDYAAAVYTQGSRALAFALSGTGSVK